MALPDRFPWYSLVFFCLLGACGDDAPPTEDGGVLCATDGECDDGVYCNGSERCMPGDPASDGNGCLPSEPPCPEGMACDEEAMSCEGECTTPDADEDGFDDVRCGGNDCDDADPNRFPGNTEVCDVDDHDEDCDPETYGFRDADEDGVADARCCNTVDGATTCGTDCNDMAPGVNPTATESCDMMDNDCDGDTDEGVRTTCYTDADRDGFAPADATATDTCGCADGTTSVAPDGDDVDCDDGSSSRSPSVTEECNAVDDDCDTAVDEDLVTVTRYVDTDGDGYAGDPVERCEGDPGSEATSSDCDESRTDTFVGATELCDGIDNDCSGGGGTDLGEDMDGDGHSPTGSSCTGGPFPTDDCNDADDTAYLGAAEICDGADDDCDGDVDERATTDAVCDASITPGTAICLGGDCHVASCPPGTEDCNGDLSDGCETDVYGSSDHCGRCGSVCLGACVSGRCTVRATQIAAHTGHTCVVLDDGNVACWGYRTGLESGASPVLVPTLVPISGVRSLATGNSLTCAVTAADDVTCWGKNEAGQVGIGTISEFVMTPTSLAGAAGVTAMSFAGARHACALETDGTARCWGYDRHDQLGDQVADHMVSGCVSGYDCSPTPVDVLELSGIVGIGLGSSHSCFLLDDGTVQCLGARGQGVLGDDSPTGRPNPEPVPGLSGVTQLASGNGHNCVLLTGGDVECWGANFDGQIGNTAVGSSADEGPVPVMGLSGVTSIEMGTASSAAILADGTVRSWGDNFGGQLGDGTEDDRTTPVVTVDVRDASQLGVGKEQACVLRVDGSVACWGRAGHLGDGTDVQRSLSAPARRLNEPVSLALGPEGACALRASGDGWCWGSNTWGEVGNGEFGAPGPDNVVRFPQQIADIDDFVALSAGCGIRDDGTLWCWGLNGSSGRLGNGTTGGASNRPQQVPGLSGVTAFEQYDHRCAVQAGGQVSCWGRNLYGQVGGGSDPQTSPLVVPGVTNAVDVALTRTSSCALLADGSTDCWGASTLFPERLTGLRAIEGGREHYCGIRVDGQVLCVGFGNDEGQVGNGTRDPVTTPHPVDGMTNAVAIGLGARHSCAVLDDGTVWCWGDNVADQLGSGTSDALTPRQVPGIDDAIDVTAASNSTCIQHRSGRFTCWGSGSTGQLGTGSTVTSSPPARAIWH